MPSTKIPAEAQAAVRARQRKEIAELDYRRELRRLSELGHTQTQIAKWLRISQPSVLSALRTAGKVPMPEEGFSGATPYEICQRYAGGLIDRAQLVDELTRFPYAEGGHTDGYDSLIVDPPGTWSEVSDARRHGLIEDDVYEEVFNRRHNPAEVETVLPSEKETSQPSPSRGVAKTQELLIAKKRALYAAQAIAKELGGAQVTTTRGRIFINAKDGFVLEMKNARDDDPRRGRTRKYSVSRVPPGKTAISSHARAAHLETRSFDTDTGYIGSD